MALVLETPTHHSAAPSARRQIGQHLLVVFGMAWTAYTTWWVLRLWGVLRDAGPVIALFEAEAGGAIDENEWMTHAEAQAIFCPHPDVDPGTTRIGRFIDASWAYTPALIMVGVPTYGVGGVLALFAATARSNFVRLIAVVIVAAGLLQLGLLISEWGTLQTLTYITE